jgi:hypothetical protein
VQCARAFLSRIRSPHDCRFLIRVGFFFVGFSLQALLPPPPALPVHPDSQGLSQAARLQCQSTPVTPVQCHSSGCATQAATASGSGSDKHGGVSILRIDSFIFFQSQAAITRWPPTAPTAPTGRSSGALEGSVGTLQFPFLH